jgi:NAD(P)-dependent dehydrogenase (short-subunit alcohol dehydrogenase family)
MSDPTVTTATGPAHHGLEEFRLDGRVALVTGGTRGIGAAISRSLASQGAIVAAGYASNRQRAEEFLDELKQVGADVSIHQCNVGHPDDCQHVLHDTIEQHGRLDILVNNAGITRDHPVWKMTVEEWHQVLRVNLSGAFYMSKPALEHMIERGSGRIINISSLIGQMGNIGQANYAASKSGLIGLTMTLAREAAFALERAGKLEEYGIGLTVNAVAPGFVATEMLGSVPEKVLDRMKAQIPVRRLGHPEEIARAVHFLAVDAASYVTGQVLSVNGGMDM